MIPDFDQFQKELSDKARLKLDLVINENRSTMLSILDKTHKSARVSIHRMFLEAPEEVLSAVADFIRDRKTEKPATATINDYIHSNLKNYNYKHLLKEENLQQEGNFYNLQQLYNSINQEYFDGKLQLSITWYGNNSKTRSHTFTFGQYLESLKLIKIHKKLDSAKCPEYFIRFVIYHEMLHNVYPPYVDETGKSRIHGPEFKQAEKQFKEYQKAKDWEKKYRHSFFK